MYNCCDQCHYVFSPEPLPHRSPDCGELCVRMATEEASAEQKHLLRVVENEDWDDTLKRSSVVRIIGGIARH